MSTTRHSWQHNRTDTDGDYKIEFCTCCVCGLVRVTQTNSNDKKFEVKYVDIKGEEHLRKLPFPCKEHCDACKQEVAFEGLT